MALYGSARMPGSRGSEVNSPLSIFLRDGDLDAIRFQGNIYASSVGSNAVARLVPDKQTGRPEFVPVTGANQGWTLMDFKDPTGKTPDQLLASTSDGVLRVAGDKLVPTMPAVHGPTEQTYTILQSQKTPSRVFIGHSDAVGSMRWDGKTWIDEGRLPHAVYESRYLVEDPEGILWASGGKGKVLRITIAPTGMKDSKFEEVSKDAGISDGTVSVAFVAGSIFAAVDRSKDLLRWDPATHKFVVDNRFLLPLDFPDASAGLLPFKRDDLSPNGSFWSVTTSSEGRRIGLFSKQADGSWHVDENTYRKLDRYGVYYFRTDHGWRDLGNGRSFDSVHSRNEASDGAIVPNLGAPGECGTKRRIRWPDCRGCERPAPAAREQQSALSICRARL